MKTDFESGFETGRVVFVVERSKRKKGVKGPLEEEEDEEKDVSHPKTMPLAAGKNCFQVKYSFSFTRLFKPFFTKLF